MLLELRGVNVRTPRCAHGKFERPRSPLRNATVNSRDSRAPRTLRSSRWGGLLPLLLLCSLCHRLE